MFLNLILISTIRTSLSLADQSISHNLTAIVAMVLHQIFRPIVKPAMDSEEVEVYSLIQNGMKSLPNTWESRPNLCAD